MSIFFSERYMQLEPYTPGEQPQDRRYIKLNTNESPFPPAPGGLRAVEEEAKRLVDLGARIIGVNCRDLRTFKVFPEKSEAVIESLPKDVAKVAESGLKTPDDLKMYPAADAFLIGEALVRSNDPGTALRGFINAR